MKFFTLPNILTLIPAIQGAIKTSIYIDKVPGYAALAPCAQNRLSAIVRGQSSGCGDQQQLTSFSCFCIDRSTYMVSVISTAVRSYCAANATATINSTESASITIPESLTTNPPEARSAVDVFNDYCARSTELTLYQGNNKSSSTQSSLTAPTIPPILPTLSTIIITAAPTLTTAVSPAPSPVAPVIPVAVIAAPLVIGILTIAGIVGMVFWLRKTRLPSTTAHTSEENPESDEVYIIEGPPREVNGDSVKYLYELETKPAELQGTND